MSEATEKALLALFKEKMDEISIANAKLRKWMYSLMLAFGIGLLGMTYWAGTMNQNVKTITKQVDRMEEKFNNMVLFMAREFKYNPNERGEKVERTTL